MKVSQLNAISRYYSAMRTLTRMAFLKEYHLLNDFTESKYKKPLMFIRFTDKEDVYHSWCNARGVKSEYR